MYGDDAVQFPISQGSSRGPQIVIRRRRSSSHSQEFVLVMKESAPYSCKESPKFVNVQMQRSVNAIRRSEWRWWHQSWLVNESVSCNWEEGAVQCSAVQLQQSKCGVFRGLAHCCPHQPRKRQSWWRVQCGSARSKIDLLRSRTHCPLIGFHSQNIPNLRPFCCSVVD